MWEFLLGHAIGEDAARARHRRECCCCRHDDPPARTGPSLWETAFTGTHRQWPFVVAALLWFAFAVYSWFVPVVYGSGAFVGLILWVLATIIADIPPRRNREVHHQGDTDV